MGDDEMTTNIPTSTRLKLKVDIIEGIERGLADIKAGRTVSHEVAMTSLRKIIDAAAGDVA